MEHTFSLHDSAPASHTPAVEPFELPSPYDPPPAPFESTPAPFESTPSYETPASLHPFPVAESTDAPNGWVQEEVPDETGETHYTDGGAMRRIVLRLSGGEVVELGSTSDAESTGEWPEFDGRFLRPDTIVSVDVQVAE
jgi:hypothetical protein